MLLSAKRRVYTRKFDHIARLNKNLLDGNREISFPVQIKIFPDDKHYNKHISRKAWRNIENMDFLCFIYSKVKNDHCGFVIKTYTYANTILPKSVQYIQYSTKTESKYGHWNYSENFDLW